MYPTQEFVDPPEWLILTLVADDVDTWYQFQFHWIETETETELVAQLLLRINQPTQLTTRTTTYFPPD